MGDLVTGLLDIARKLIIVVGGGAGIINIVKGKSDENPKLFEEGLATIGIAGALYAATFAIAAAFK